MFNSDRQLNKCHIEVLSKMCESWEMIMFFSNTFFLHRAGSQKMFKCQWGSTVWEMFFVNQLRRCDQLSLFTQSCNGGNLWSLGDILNNFLRGQESQIAYHLVWTLFHRVEREAENGIGIICVAETGVSQATVYLLLYCLLYQYDSVSSSKLYCSCDC